MSKNEYTPKTKSQFDAYTKAMDAANESFAKKKPPAKKPAAKKPAPKKNCDK